MKNESIFMYDSEVPATGFRKIGSLLTHFVGKFGAGSQPAGALYIRVSKEEGMIHRIESFDVEALPGDIVSPFQGGYENGRDVHVFLHDQSIVSGVIMAQDDDAYLVSVTEWTYFDNSILATMNPTVVQSKVERIVARGSDIITRCNAILADAKLVHFNRSGAIIGSAGMFAIGDRVQIALGDHRPICGVVRWHFTGLAGLEFLRPLTTAERVRWIG